MSVNLKGRKNAQSEQAVPAPELVMAGGQTPWGNDAPPPVSNPFAEVPAATGMPTMPPPPPPGEEGEDAEANTDAPVARKAPSRNLIIAVVAVLALAGGGYYWTQMRSSGDPAPTPVAKHVLLPGSPAAKAAAARAAAAAKAAAAKGGTKPTVAAVKPGTKPTVAAVKPGTTAKATTAPGKAPVAAPVAASTPFTAALPGRIGEWSKLVSAKIPQTLAKYDSDLGTSPSNVAGALYGGTEANPYLLVVAGDHAAGKTKSALEVLKVEVKDLQSLGFVVARPTAVGHTPYGGSAACTTAAKNDVLSVYCVWMDNNTFGLITAPHRAENQAVQILAMVRGSVEH